MEKYGMFTTKKTWELGFPEIHWLTRARDLLMIPVGPHIGVQVDPRISIRPRDNFGSLSVGLRSRGPTTQKQVPLSRHIWV